MIHEIVWDGTRAHNGRYLVADDTPARPAPPEPDLFDGPKNRKSPIQAAVFALLCERPMAIADIVEHLKAQHSQSAIYSAVASLRTMGAITAVRRERRTRANGGGSMLREIYGPAAGAESISYLRGSHQDETRDL